MGQLEPARQTEHGRKLMFTNVFAGQIRTGDFANTLVPYSTGWNYVCSQIYKDGHLLEDDPAANTKRGLNMPVPHNGDIAYLMLGGEWKNSGYSTKSGVWSAITNWDVSGDLGPRIYLGQCFLYGNNASTNTTWVQGAHY